jgi:hypothetical protein
LISEGSTSSRSLTREASARIGAAIERELPSWSRAHYRRTSSYLDIYSEKGTYVQAQQEFIGFCRRYGIRKAYVERAGQQIVFIDQLRDLCRKEGLSVIIEEVTTGVKSKDDRILGLEEPFQRATIYVGRGPKFLEFKASTTLSQEPPEKTS